MLRRLVSLATICVSLAILSSSAWSAVQSNTTAAPGVQSIPQPKLSLSTNPKNILYKGWALIVDISVQPPTAADTSKPATSMVISPKNGAWTAAMRIVVNNSSGASQKWPLHLKAISEKSMTLDAKSQAAATWYLSPEETASLPVGKYQLSATLDIKEPSDPSGWKGSVTSPEMTLRIAAEPSQADDLKEAKVLNLAMFTTIKGDLPAALLLIDNFLKDQPASFNGLSAKAWILEDMGNFKGALQANNAAMLQFNKAYPNDDPPLTLLDTQQRILNALLKPTPADGPPHAPEGNNSSSKEGSK